MRHWPWFRSRPTPTMTDLDNPYESHPSSIDLKTVPNVEISDVILNNRDLRKALARHPL